MLFGTQLGGGTDINRAVAYCQGLITRPRDTLFVLISDLYEGGIEDADAVPAARDDARPASAVVVLLALSDEGAPSYDADNAAALARWASRRSPARPDAFPDLLAAALAGRDLAAWAHQHSLAAR